VFYKHVSSPIVPPREENLLLLIPRVLTSWDCAEVLSRGFMDIVDMSSEMCDGSKTKLTIWALLRLSVISHVMTIILSVEFIHPWNETYLYSD
jgi:hypothetical protein